MKQLHFFYHKYLTFPSVAYILNLITIWFALPANDPDPKTLNKQVQPGVPFTFYRLKYPERQYHDFIKSLINCSVEINVFNLNQTGRGLITNFTSPKCYKMLRLK